MKRHEALIPLTHDHHHALVQVRRLGIAAGGDEAQRRTATHEFLDFFEQETLGHFREEEEVVFPLVAGRPEAQDGLTRLLMEHARILALVGALRSELDKDGPSGETMAATGALLQAHIRFEEKTLFPLIERLVPGRLEGIHLSARERIQGRYQ